MPRLIVFDLDGTLIESRRDLADATNALIKEHGGVGLDQAAIVAMVGDGVDELVRRALAAAGIGQAPAGAVERFLAIYHAVMLRHTHAYPGVVEMLDGLRGRVAMAVLSNKPRASCTIILEALGLADYFHRIEGGDGPWPKKPDPAGLRALITEAGAGDEALLVGDSPVDLRTARAAGVGVCLARYGFGYARITPDMLAEGDWQIDQPQDLLRLLG